MSVINSVALLMGDEGYQISRSVRLRSSASAYFNRTPASAGNRQKFTISLWVKRGKLASSSPIMGAGPSSATEDRLMFSGGDSLLFDGYNAGSTVFAMNTSAVYRDPSAWYHVVVAVDTTQATASNRILMYVNGAQITSFATSTYPAQNANLNINNNVAQYLGYTPDPYYADQYLTEVNFIDGQALTPSSFGETDTITGVWKPKKYAGTYGTNGFYLNFSDNSAATAAAIGKDSSGNGNNWTPNNISVTSGVTYDSMIDTPTPYADGGNGRGNYAVINPLDSFSTGGVTISDANLTAAMSRATYNCWVRAGIQIPTSGKWYFEMTPTAVSVISGTLPYITIGVISAATLRSDQNTGSSFNARGYSTGTGNKESYTNGTGTGTAYGGTTALNNTVRVAVDMDSGKIFFGNSTGWFNSGDPVAGTNAAFTDLVSSGYAWVPLMLSGGQNSNTGAFNFGQRPFAYTPPTGFKALNTQNLPEPTIKKGNQYFNATTYTGNGTSLTVTNSGSMQPDLVWIKDRTGGNNHMLFDSVRGVLNGLTSNSTSAEASFASSLTSFNSNGFSVGNYGNVNLNSSSNYIGWQWKEGATPGFDIVTYTGDGVSGRTVSHSLGIKPKMMIVKLRSGNASTLWFVYHEAVSSTPQNDYLQLQSTSAKASASSVWNNTAPTSSVFSLGNDTSANANGSTYVAYLFAEVAGFSKFGAYTGNGSADGPFVFCGFRPRFVLIKRTDASASNWQIFDTARSTYNVNVQRIFANDPSAELTGEAFDILSNGFKPRLSGTGTDSNSTGGTYIYAAFAENPFKYSLAR